MMGRTSYAWCTQVLKALYSAGVVDLIVSPGSRSTPLVLAALDSPLELVSIVDERSAAFFALGRARATKVPVALVCTSGSAGAHWLPAFIEARYSGHCLVALTADRPMEQHDAGENQTIDQRNLLAAACPPCLDLGTPDSFAPAQQAVYRRVYQRVIEANGPVHVNLPFRKPLEPQSRPQGQAATTYQPRGPVLHPPELRASEAALEEVAALCRQAKRGIIVAGPETSDQLGPNLIALAKKTGFVLLAEATSGARYTGTMVSGRCDGFVHTLLHPSRSQELHPDLVLQFGMEPASGVLNRWLGTLDCDIVQFCARQMRFPSNCLRVIQGDTVSGVLRLINRLETRRSGTHFRENWMASDERVWRAVQRTMEANPSEAQGMNEAQAMATVLRSLPANCQLTIGNSLPIRALDAVLPGHLFSARVLHQRGASGIEGLIAGAIGSSTQSFSTLILGDVACAHDLASLTLHRYAKGPLAIVMFDNGGGQIFDHLPVSKVDLRADERVFWTTPQNLDWQSIVTGYGVSYVRAESYKALTSAMRDASLSSGCTFIHVPVVATSYKTFLTEVQEHLAEDSPL